MEMVFMEEYRVCVAAHLKKCRMLQSFFILKKRKTPLFFIKDSIF